MPLPRRKPKTRPTFPDRCYKLLAMQREETPALSMNLTAELMNLSEKLTRQTKHMIQQLQTDETETMTPPRILN